MRRSLHADLPRFGHLVQQVQLRRLGYTDREVRQAVREGALHRIGRSWLASLQAEPDAVRAVALGGKLAAASALQSYGVWVSRPEDLWLSNPTTAARRPPTGLREHRLWYDERFRSRADRQWRVSVPDALLQYLGIAREEDVVAAADSALNKRLITPALLDDVFNRAPRRIRRLRRKIDGRAQSGLETIMRLACQARGWKAEVQVRVDGVGRVDLLIDGWLVVELDGSRWHDGEASRDEDARRDSELTLLGYRYHRFRHGQVMRELERCLDVIAGILADGCPSGLGRSSR